MTIEDKARDVINQLANTSGAEFKDEKLAIEILVENFRNL